MNKKVKKMPKGKKLDQDEELDPIGLEDDEDEDEDTVDPTVDPDVLKVLKPEKPKQTQKPVASKQHDYIAELERDEDAFDDL